MLPKKKRVTKESFQTLMKEGKTFSTRLFLFYYVEGGARGSVNTPTVSDRRHIKSVNTSYHLKNDSPQYVFVAPKKIFKNAVKRNKFRRIGYNILRFIPLKSGSGIFVYKKQAITATTQEIKEDISFVLTKTGLL